MRSVIISLLVALCGCAAARAQNPLDDIYNWREPKSATDPAAVKKWPPYYKPSPLSPEHHLKYAMGWCTIRTPLHFRATPTYTIDPDDIINVNKLPETNFAGKIVANRDGQLLVRNEAKEQFNVIIHPDPKLCHVAVGGEALPEALKPGMYVRFSGKVDQRGDVSEVTGLELVAEHENVQTTKVRVDERQMIVARVVNRQGDQLTLRTKSDGLTRLTVKLSDADRIGLHCGDYLLATEGDDITVKGKVHRDDSDTDPSATSGNDIFAADVQIKLAEPVANVIKGRRRKS